MSLWLSFSCVSCLLHGHLHHWYCLLTLSPRVTYLLSSSVCCFSPLSYYEVEGELVLSPRFKRIIQINDSLRSYINFKVQNMILSSKDPREPVKSYCLDTGVIHSFNKCYLNACSAPGHWASHQGLKFTGQSWSPPFQSLKSSGFSMLFQTHSLSSTWQMIMAIPSHMEVVEEVVSCLLFVNKQWHWNPIVPFSFYMDRKE